MIYDTDYGVYNAQIGAAKLITNEHIERLIGRVAIDFEFEGGKKNDDGSFDIERFVNNGINEIGLFNFWIAEMMKHFTDLIKNSDPENDDPEKSEKIVRYAEFVSFLHDLSEKLHYEITQLYRWEALTEEQRARDGAPLKETVFPQDFEPQPSKFAEPNLKNLTAKFAEVMENPLMPENLYNAIADAVAGIGGKSHRKFTAENVLRNFEILNGQRPSSFYEPPGENSNAGTPPLDLSNVCTDFLQTTDKPKTAKKKTPAKPKTTGKRTGK